MKVSREGLVELAEHEGIVLGPYKDSVGVWTYGVGHTASAGGVDPAEMQKIDTRNWSMDQVRSGIAAALTVYAEDLVKYERRVEDAVDVPLGQHQFDALVSFDFNTGGIYRANLTKSLNTGDYISAGQQFMGWLKPPEIAKRRRAEKNLFSTGNYDGNGDDIAVYDARGDGGISHRMTIRGAEVLRLLGEQRSGTPFGEQASPIAGTPAPASGPAASLIGAGLAAAGTAVALWWEQVTAFFQGLF